MAYDYGAVMAATWPEGWEDILSSIDRHDLYCGDDGTYGLETEPHVTVLYGLHKEVHEDLVCRMCQAFEGPVQAEVTGLSTFDNDDYDVLKLDVESDALRKLNKGFKGLPYTTEYEDYNPHMTIAYLKKGTAEKYDDLDKHVPKKLKFPRFEFTPAGEEESLRFPIHH
jgi:2'-5' RNA ligase